MQRDLPLEIGYSLLYVFRRGPRACFRKPGKPLGKTPFTIHRAVRVKPRGPFTYKRLRFRDETCLLIRCIGAVIGQEAKRRRSNPGADSSSGLRPLREAPQRAKLQARRLRSPNQGLRPTTGHHDGKLIVG